MSGGFFTDAGALAAALERGGVAAMAAVHTTMEHSAQTLKARVQEGASGRPGPNVITGRYRASWAAQVTGAGPMVVAEVGTNAAQARRLEYGFAGADSLGRIYHQPPFPHLGPAVQEAGPALVRELGTAVRTVL
ncbi:HK97 gp10 family phage protein [Streptomyces sp. NPDC049555]|uniref:HK97 gp10 family phage protein n=1 Tax=Streptomyces sp. NPDC049555 TaxID=3154930 RepID=UPI003435F003